MQSISEYDHARWAYLQVAHEISESRTALLLQQVLQADDERNSVLYEGLLPDLWIKSWIYDEITFNQSQIFHLLKYKNVKSLHYTSCRQFSLMHL